MRKVWLVKFTPKDTAGGNVAMPPYYGFCDIQQSQIFTTEELARDLVRRTINGMIMNEYTQANVDIDIEEYVLFETNNILRIYDK